MSMNEGSSQGIVDKGKSVRRQPGGQSGWSRFNLLSLDGGGIRGFWTLLVLEKLMELIGIEEERLANDRPTSRDPSEGLHSFWPQSWPGDNITLVDFRTQERDGRQNARGEGAQLEARKLAALRKTRRYLPCHYFDYICGSSTGALIAIMLGRFRMTVCDCIDEYKRFGKVVFGRPRMLREENTMIIPRPKYDANLLEQVFRDVTYYRCERRDKNSGPVTIATAPGLCKTFVTTLRKEQDGHSAKVFLIRSYRLLKWESQPGGRLKLRSPATFANSRTVPTLVNGGGSAESDNRRNINYGAASPLEIWEVARAATAALFYFDPLKIDLHPIPVNGKPIYAIFEDGGFGDSNNPTNLGIEEIRDLHGDSSIDVVVSIGTARSDKREGKGFRSKIITIGDRGTNPEIAHGQVLEKSRDKEKGFKYYRLNGTLEENTALEVPLDEWKPKGRRWRLGSGHSTLNKIESGFNQWYTSESNREMLQECAVRLVQRRQERITEPARWERFAIGSHFYCPERNCEVDCAYRNDFEDHLISHGNIEKSDISRDLVDNYMLRWVYERREGRKDLRR